jgi:formylglycine-generating enzyme required for sulfatase activity
MFKSIGILSVVLCLVSPVIGQESPNFDWENIPGGELAMGDSYCTDEQGNSDWCSDEAPHKVSLDGFLILRSEVTNQLYYRCFKAGFCEPNELHDLRPRDFSKKNQPVVFVSWKQADSFCKWAGGRLPTEAQWEKAANRENLGGAVFGKKYDVGAPNRVESVKPNSKGLYDMLGNVYEWTQDWYGPYETTKPQLNPKGPGAGKQKVVKGGAWNSPAHYIRVSDRVARNPEYRYSDLGFRCVKLNNRKEDS